MRRLYLQIYLAFVVVGLLSVTVSGLLFVVLFGRPLDGPAEAAVGSVFAIATLPEDASYDQALRDLSARIGHDLTLRAADGTVIASAGPVLPPGSPGAFRSRSAVGLRMVLPDGRILAIASPVDAERRLQHLAWVAALGGAMAIGVYPIARRITRRLEVLQGAMGRWGEGDLAVRAPVQGRDEVAAVARTFNEAADRVQTLFDAQRRVLASASHELRSPLARLRMAIELLDDGDRGPIVADAIRDVEELDATVGDLLQVGRMQALAGPEQPEEVALLALAAEEVARVGGEASGVDRWVRGDPRLLRRLVRNLVENAERHGVPPIEVRVTGGGFEVLDRGPGIEEGLRERVFEPFFRPEGHAEGRDGSVGLGLHLVRQIAGFHGGTVHIEAREGGGTRFVVRLPEG